MDTTKTAAAYPFLAGGGEMGERTRACNWATTALGTPDQWPVSLRVTLSIVLNARFPMFLFWGDELIQFYNDAYRPSLGNNGKHPTALGQKGADCWPETWPLIKPLIDQVRAGGEATWNQDQLIPIYRNGGLEDVYWTFSYSPVKDESGQVGGVLVTCTETTNAVVNRRRLETSEARFRSIIQQTPAATLVLYGDDYTIDQINDSMVAQMGQGETVIGKPLLTVMPELEGEFAWQQVQNVYRNGVSFDGREVPVTHATAGVLQKHWYNLAYRPLWEEDNVVGMIQVVTDVTEQVLVRQKIEESEARFRSLIDESPVAICLFVGPELVIEVANEGMIRFFGRGSSIVGKPVRDVLTGQAGDSSAVTLLTQVFSTGEPFTAMAAPASLTIDGVPGTYYFDLSLKPLRNAAGDVYAILETATDVTEQVLSRQQLKESEERFRSLATQAPLAIFMADPETRVLYWNTWWLDYTGQSLEEALGRSWEQFIHPDDVDLLLTGYLTAVRAQASYSIEARVKRYDGVYNHLLFTGGPRYSVGGDCVGTVGTGLDIEDRKQIALALRDSEARYRTLSEELERTVQERTEELAATNEELATTNEELIASNDQAAAANNELLEANNLLRRSNDNLEKFAYVASHDLQEPLRKIQSFGDLLKSRYGDQLGDGVEYLERMQQAANRMSTLIRDLLTFSRIATQRETTSPVPLGDVLNSVLTDLDLRIQETGAAVKVGPMPVLQGDRPQLEQLFQNLLGNALKFHRAGIPPVVTISSQLVASLDLPPSVNPIRPARDYYRIDVADNGIGFDEKYLDRIFQVFQRLSGRTQYAGTGIGLAICEKVVTNHGGAITARSQPGQGATFSVYLPA